MVQRICKILFEYWNWCFKKCEYYILCVKKWNPEQVRQPRIIKGKVRGIEAFPDQEMGNKVIWY